MLKDLEQRLDDYCELNDEGKAAFRMAITALELFGISEQFPSSQPFDAQIAYYKGLNDGIAQCTERLKRLTDEMRRQKE